MMQESSCAQIVRNAYHCLRQSLCPRDGVVL